MAGRSVKGGGGKVTNLDDARKKTTGLKDDGLPKNNLQAIRDAEQAQLLSALSRIRPLIADVDAAKAVVKSKQELVDQAMNDAAAAGFKKGEIRELLKETAVKGSRKDQREVEERRLRFRRYCGLPVGETDDGLLDPVPEAAKDEIDWRGHGYTAGLRADDADPKKANVPPRFHAAWLEEWHRGQEQNAWAMNPDARPKPGAKLGGPVSLEGEAHLKTDGDEFEAGAEELAAQTARPSTIEATDPEPPEGGDLADATPLNEEAV